MMNYKHYDMYVELYERDREAALQLAFDQTSRRPYMNAATFIWASAYGRRLPLMRYGMCQIVKREELVGRRFEITLTSYLPSILWLDVVHNEKTHRLVPLTEAEYNFDELVLSNATISHFGQVTESN